MKRALVISLLMLTMSAVAFAGPSLNPWFEVNVPEIVKSGGGYYMAAPTLEAGATVEGMLSGDWFIDLGFAYLDDDLLDNENSNVLAFASDIGLDKIATVNQTGSLKYGCNITLGLGVDYLMDYQDGLVIEEFTPGFVVEGYVGPLSIWGGLALPWAGGNWLDFVPSFGMRVDFILDL